MDRILKFRALPIVIFIINNIKFGDFVYGHYIESGCDAPCDIFGDGEQIEVNKKTLGQFTGLKDKNGVEIYEGDILVKKCSKFCSIGVVKVIHGCWMVCGGESDDPYFNLYHYKELVEIIGNIHKNPELLTTDKE